MHGSHFLVVNLALGTWAELTAMQFAVVKRKLCFHCHLSDASYQVSCWVQSSSFANMPLRSVSVLPFSWWLLAKEHQRIWTCQWNRTKCPTESRAKQRRGQMRKCLDGGVHQGGCSGLGLGSLEGFMGGWERIPVPPKQEHSNYVGNLSLY